MLKAIPLLIVCLIADTQMASAQKRKFVPDFAVTQYAGSIGYASLGIGYRTSKRTSFSLHYGYVPQHKGGELNIAAAKFLVNTYTFRISEALQFEPFRFGAMVSYHFGREFRSSWPTQRYPDGYYWWKTSLRAHVVSQTSLTLHLNNARLHSLTAYIDFNTNELYLISYFQNHRALRLADIIKAGYGLRANF
jgi:hypothetical protein